MRKILARLHPFLRLIADADSDAPRVTVLGPSDRPGNYGYDIVLNIETEDGNEWAIPIRDVMAAAEAAGGEGVNEVSDRVICSACGCSIPRSSAKPSGDGWIAIDLAVCCGCRLVAQGAEWEALALKREEEIERLRAIVDTLPKTADGVSVTPGMAVYVHSPLENRVLAWTVKLDTNYLRVWQDEDNYDEYEVEQSYSTREAAEAAGGGE